SGLGGLALAAPSVQALRTAGPAASTPPGVAAALPPPSGSQAPDSGARPVRVLGQQRGPRGLHRSPAASVPAQLFSPSPQRAALKPEREGAEREAAGAAGPRRHWRRTGGARGGGARRAPAAEMDRASRLAAPAGGARLPFLRSGEASGNRPSWMDGYGERGRTFSPGILADLRLPSLQLPRSAGPQVGESELKFAGPPPPISTRLCFSRVPPKARWMR
ncbi:hypothetical protein EI555_019376, partial [Monodon monoceros]